MRGVVVAGRRRVLTVLSSVLAVGCGAPTSELPPSQPHPILGRAVGFSLPDDQGQLRAVPDAAYQATVLDFWATDCAPCARSVPALAARRAALAGAGVQLHFVGVLRRDESLKAGRQALDAWGTDTPFLADRDGGVQRRLDLSLLPATLVLDAGGHARWLAGANTTTEQIVSAATQIASGD